MGTAVVQEHVLSVVYSCLEQNGVMLEGTLLKPSMTVNGVECKNKASPEEVAKMTVQTFERTIPCAVPGVTFLSGGLSEEDSSIFLNEINKLDRRRRSCSRARRPTRRRRRASTSRARSRRSSSRCTSRTTST